MAHQGKKPSRKLDSNMSLLDDLEVDALKRTVTGGNANLAHKKPSIQDDDDRSADEDSQSSDTEGEKESDADSSSVATDT